MSDIEDARKVLLKRILEGADTASASDLRAAFDLNGPAGPISTLVDKVAKHASGVTDDDISAVKALGFNENQIFEIVVCAAVGQANRQYEAALAAVKAATSKE